VSVARDGRGWRRHDPARRPCWVLEEDGQVIAWLSLEDYKDRAAYSITAEVSVYVDARGDVAATRRLLLDHAIEQAPGLALERLVGVYSATTRQASRCSATPASSAGDCSPV
jgi:L-amino acid N-acyltransferase YncA